MRLRTVGGRSVFTARRAGANPRSACCAEEAAAPGTSFSAQLLFQPFDLVAQVRDPVGHRSLVYKEDGPHRNPCCKKKLEILHRTSFPDTGCGSTLRDSASCCNSASSCRRCSSLYRSLRTRIIVPTIATMHSPSTLPIVGSRAESGPPKITGCGCCVRHNRFDM